VWKENIGVFIGTPAWKNDGFWLLSGTKAAASVQKPFSTLVRH
jgi:hypothetical protein